MIEIACFAYLDKQFTFDARSDFFLVVLGSMIAAIGAGAIAVQIFRRRRRERFLLWFGIFACPYGVRLLSNTWMWRAAFGEPRLAWQFAGAFVDLALIIPALLLFQSFYGTGWRSSVRWLVWGYTGFATIAFTLILITRRPDLFPTAGIGTVFFLPLIILLNWAKGYRLRWAEDRGVLAFGLIILFLAFAYDRFARVPLLSSRLSGTPSPSSAQGLIEPCGVFVLICCLGYAAMRRVFANERELASLGEELRAAREIQNSILPTTAPTVPGFHAAFRYAPMTAVAGDFYDFLPVAPGGLGVIVADVAGHGVPAALVASMLKAAISSTNTNLDHPSQMIAGLNATLCGQTKDQYATAVYAYLDEASRVARYSGAGHPPPLLWQKATQRLLPLREGGLLLGVRPDEAYPEEEFSLEAGDRLLIYTDGLIEATSPDGTEFGKARLEEFVASCATLSTDHFAARLLEEVLAWPGATNRQSQADDITIVVIDAGS